VGATPGVAKARRRITQTDIARAAGVHNATVSLALRNCPSIPEATRQRIQALARQLGYSPDPALRALVAYRRGLAAHSRSEVIAFITHGPTRGNWRETPLEARYFVGAQRKATECGYQLEHFWLGEPGLSPRRLSDMLFHRGVTGVLLGAQSPGVTELPDFAWERLAAVQLGCRPLDPALHRVTSNLEGSIRLALRRASAAGCRRIGLVLPAAWDRASDRTWSTSFIVEQSRLSAAARIPVLLQGSLASDGPPPAGASPEVARLANWFSEFRPDAVLGSWALTAPMWADLGLRVPQDLAFIDLLHDGTEPALAGVRQNGERAGEVAVEVLIHQLQQNLRGLPDTPTTTLVESVWCDGASLPPTQVAPWTTAMARANNPGIGPREQSAA
jgi:LacI family transcriptional regulator